MSRESRVEYALRVTAEREKMKKNFSKLRARERAGSGQRSSAVRAAASIGGGEIMASDSARIEAMRAKDAAKREAKDAKNDKRVERDMRIATGKNR